MDYIINNAAANRPAPASLREAFRMLQLLPYHTENSLDLYKNRPRGRSEINDKLT
jgi:hypothetical protein